MLTTFSDMGALHLPVLFGHRRGKECVLQYAISDYTVYASIECLIQLPT